MICAADTKTERPIRHHKQDSFAFLRRKTAEAAEKNAAKRKQEEIASKQLFLPGMDEHMRAMPNHIARSSLFAPVALGRKKIHDGTILVSRRDAVIRFSGKQLDETQADVWMQTMHEATKQPLGQSFKVNRAAFLKSIGRAVSGQNYRWLHQSLKDLAFAMLVIEVTKDGKSKLSIGDTDVLHMIDGFGYDNNSESYLLRIDPRWRRMYDNREFSLVDWDTRLQFGQHQNMAKALQRLLATSSDRIQRYALDWLMGKMIYHSPTRKFREALNSACKELVRLEIVSEWSIKDSTKAKPQLSVWLPPKS